MSTDNGQRNPSTTGVGYVQRAVVTCAIVAGGVAALLLLWFQLHVLLLGFAGVLLGVFLYTISRWLQSRVGMKYWLCLTVVCSLLLILLSVAGWLMDTRIEQEVRQLQRQLPDAFEQLHAHLKEHQWGRWLLEKLRSEVNSSGISAARTGVTSVIAYAVEFFVVVFVGLFAAINSGLYVRGFVRLLPTGRPRELARECIADIRRALWWWLVGQLIAMAFIGVVTALVLWMLGVPLAMVLGLLAGLLNFVPNFGPLLSAIPALLMAMLQSGMLVLWVALAYCGIQTIQNHIVTPLVQQRVANLPPILLMLSQIFMYYWDGALGMILAPPLVLVVIRLVKILYLRDEPDPTSADRKPADTA